MRGTEKVLDEAPLFLVRSCSCLPDAEPSGRLVGFRHPQLALFVDHQAGRIEHPIRHPGPDGRAAARAADPANGLAVGHEDSHLLLGPLHAHVEPALVVGRHAADTVETGEDRLHGTRLRVDRKHVAAILHDIDKLVAHGPDEAGLFDVDELQDRACASVEHGHEVDPDRKDVFREGLLQKPTVCQLEIRGGKLGRVRHEAPVAQHAVQDTDHVVTDVGCVVVGPRAQLVQIQGGVLLKPLDLGLGVPVELRKNLSGKPVSGGEPEEEGFPVTHVEAAETRRAAADVNLAAQSVHAFDPVGHAGGLLPDAADRQGLRVLALPRHVGAGLGVEPVDHLPPLVDIDDAVLSSGLVHGHDLGAPHPAVGVFPLHVALEIAGQEGTPRLGPGPAEVDLLAIGRAGERHTVVAAPVGCA